MKFVKRYVKPLLVLLVPLCVLLCFIAYHCIHGRLLPFMPGIIGFEHKDFSRARVYYHKGADLSTLDQIDQWVEDVERSHGMKFPKRLDVLLCSSDNEYTRFSGTRARSCSMPIHGRICLSHRAQEDAKAGTIHLDVYMRHEMSHSILYQNMRWLMPLESPNWLMEGLAVFHAGQRGVDGYFTRDQVREKMREGYFLNPLDYVSRLWGTSPAFKEFPLPNKWWFIYSEMACFIEDLIQSRGEDKFQLFLAGVLQGQEAAKAFQSVYCQDIDSQVEEYRKRMLN